MISEVFAQSAEAASIPLTSTISSIDPWVYVGLGVIIVIVAFVITLKGITIAFGNSALMVAGAVISCIGVIQNFELTPTGIKISTSKVVVEQLETLNKTIEVQDKLNKDLDRKVRELEIRMSALSAVTGVAPSNQPPGAATGAPTSNASRIDEAIAKSIGAGPPLAPPGDIIRQNIDKNVRQLDSIKKRLGL